MNFSVQKTIKIKRKRFLTPIKRGFQTCKILKIPSSLNKNPLVGFTNSLSLPIDALRSEKDFLEYVDDQGDTKQYHIFSVGQIMPLLTQLLALVMALLYLARFLFLSNGYEGLTFAKPYQIGNAPQVFAAHMTLQDKATGEIFLQNLSYITDYFEEICFKYFVFKTPFHDHCEQFDAFIKENHGYSNFF